MSLNDLEIRMEKTTLEYWDQAWSKPPRLSLPSRFNLSIRNAKRLLGNHVKPGMCFLEIGCAPGKMLAWVSFALKARVAGIDYSKRGIMYAQQIFHTVGLEGDLRCEDIFHTTFKPGTFDIVYSNGVIEHFNDAREIVRQHVLLLKPYGKALIVIPKLSGPWQKLTRWLAPDILSMHNLALMNPISLKEVAPTDLVKNVQTYHAGHISVWHAIPPRGLPAAVRMIIAGFVDLLGFLQPFEIGPLCPTLVLEMTRLDGTAL
jgi:2-polyprenyl-3-methyl-5-hydroxy-6-metoxy-1,4-benzoquinol methylase